MASEPTSIDVFDTADGFFGLLKQAWDDGDADRFASLFAEQAIYVVWLGFALIGRAAIADGHRELFRGHRSAGMAIRLLGTQVLCADAIVVTTLGGVGGGERPVYDKIQTFALRRGSTGWECVAFQNTHMDHQTREAFNA
jgi:uncharacterized protein (TIGR02246 family)